VLLGVEAPNWFIVSRSHRDTPNTSTTYYMRQREANAIEIAR
jgi:hypothetical protein